MTREIPKEKWKDFFDELSRKKFNWETMVQVFNYETGAQILNESLPFAGITFEEKNGQKMIEIIVGNGLENHQSHTIFDPEKIAFATELSASKSTLDLEDKSGTKTLVTFIQPTPVVEIYPENETVSLLN